MAKNKISVVDLFCGIGGLSCGLKKAGLNIRAGFDIDDTCKFAYKKNNKAIFFSQDIKTITSEDVKKLYPISSIRVLAGCAPCQPFSSYANAVKEKDVSKYDLLYEFGRLVEGVLPDIVTMENVPKILSFKKKAVLQDFIALLESLGYNVSVNTVYCPDYGIPQSRKRLVLLASKLGKIDLIAPTHTPTNYVTVRDVIGGLPPIEAGQVCDKDPLHKARSLSALNLIRIKATPYGGGWKDWDDDLKLECHKKASGSSFGGVYGRMKWDTPAPTMTTLCTGLGNGRFGHPEQDRAISLREAALFQTFPLDYIFFSHEERIPTTSISRYIGNAVPPKLGEVIGLSIKQHLKDYVKI